VTVKNSDTRTAHADRVLRAFPHGLICAERSCFSPPPPHHRMLPPGLSPDCRLPRHLEKAIKTPCPLKQPEEQQNQRGPGQLLAMLRPPVFSGRAPAAWRLVRCSRLMGIIHAPTKSRPSIIRICWAVVIPRPGDACARRGHSGQAKNHLTHTAYLTICPGPSSVPGIVGAGQVRENAWSPALKTGQHVQEPDP